MSSFTFWLGTYEPSWLHREECQQGEGVPLFVSARRLRRLKRPISRPALTAWALDSGGFSELSLHGEWTVTASRYALEVQRWSAALGQMAWAAIQDWMCEPSILAKTGLTVAKHQLRTVASYRDLLALAPEVQWLPVLQGWSRDDYLRCLDLYDAGGFDLRTVPVVGLGSVCRRQGTKEVENLIGELCSMGIKVHAFGFKTKGLARTHHLLASADSMAWSLNARKRQPMAGCTHKSCANCLLWAMRWRERLLQSIDRQ